MISHGKQFELYSGFVATHDVSCSGSDATAGAPGTALGLSLYHELYLLVHKAGLSPQEALRSATSLTARRFGFPDRSIIEAGRKADLLLVEGNPLEDIGDTLNIRNVRRDGAMKMTRRP